MRYPLNLIVTLTLVMMCVFRVFAQDQRGYHLFNPAPHSLMRPFSTDRPDITESAITVDAGHFQFEGDLLKWSRSARDASTSTLSFLNGLYKLGITHSWDIHIGLEAYNTYHDIEGKTLRKGYGSTMIRLKHNFWGNDGQHSTAFGVIPYVTFLSGNPFDSEMVYGVGLPFTCKLRGSFELGAQPQVDFVPGDDGKHQLNFLQVLVVGGTLTGNLDFFLEGLGVFTPRNNQFLIDVGLIYNMSANFKVDIAANLGLNRPAPTRAYLGFSFRI